MRYAILLLATALLPLSAPADYQDLQIARTVERVKAVQNYEGVLRQAGLFGEEPVVARVWFARPHDFHSEVSAPAELAGSLTRYTDNTLLGWTPKHEVATRLRNLVPPATATEGQRIAEGWRANTEGYFYALGKVQPVAGLPTLAVDQRARHATQLVQSSVTRVYDEFSFPLAGTLTLRGGAKLDYRYESVRFNAADLVLPPAPVLPASTLVIDWDLAGTPRSAAEVSARVPKARPFPEAVAGLRRERLLVHPESVPAVAGYYRDENYYLVVTASRDTGFQPLSREYGLDVPLGDTRARLVISPLSSTWVFRRDGVLYTALTNLHPETAYRELGSRWASTR